MKNLVQLPLVENNYIDNYVAIVSNKTHKVYKALLETEATHNIVNQRYLEYIEQRYELAKVTLSNINGDFKDALLSCYGSNNNLDVIKGEVKRLQSRAFKAKCPYCLINQPNTFDHYLSKQKFPEYCVFPHNLVPCCGMCNQWKGEHWLGENGRRKILNYYFDTLPVEKYLFAELIFVNDDIPTIKYSIILEHALEYTIQEHYRILHLIDRYEEQANDEISTLKIEISDAREVTIEQHKQTLTRRKRSYEDSYGINYWKAALIDAIITDNEDEFIKLCLRE